MDITGHNIDPEQLPALQERTRCVLIPRDPSYIYAYWNYTQEDIDGIRNQLGSQSGDSQFILRVYDISRIHFNGSNANYTWDLEVGYSSKSWYIHVSQDNTDYCAEIGIRCGGRFIPLTRSNRVRTASKTASLRNDLIWQDIKAHHESQPYVVQSSKKKLQKGKQSRRARIYQLTAQDIREYYMKLFDWVSHRGRNKRQPRASSLEDVIKGLPGGISWQKVRPVLTYPDLIKRLHQGASMEFLESKGGSESIANVQTGSSENQLNKRKFFFEVWTELIVHGRTEADAAVWLNGQGIALNADGTFSLRYALPDGGIPLKFVAQSSDKIEQRHIYTRVERERTIAFPKILKDDHA